MRVALKSQASQITFPLPNTPQQRPANGNNNFQGQMPAPPSSQDKPQLPVWLIIVAGALTTASLIVGGVMWMMRGGKTTETPTKPSALQKIAQQNFAQVAEKTINEKNASVAIALKDVGDTQGGELDGMIKTLKVAKKLDSSMPSINETQLLADYQKTLEHVTNLQFPEEIAQLYALTISLDEAGINHDYFLDPLSAIEVVNSLGNGKYGYLSTKDNRECLVHSFSPGQKLPEYIKAVTDFDTLIKSKASLDETELKKLESKLYEIIIGKLHGIDIATGELVSCDFTPADLPFPLMFNISEKGLSFVKFLMMHGNFSSLLKQEHKLSFTNNPTDFIQSLLEGLKRGEKLSKYFVTG
jgi:hypothetical protein